MSQISDPNAKVERVDMQSLDVAEHRRQELLRLFPEVRTEGSKIDFDRLKLTLGEAIDIGKERYGLTWPGKADCIRTIQTPSTATLRPVREESVNFDTTENLIIEGDNLEVLKLLQKAYLGKIKMIYIDPPYNTGNDFIYPDNYTESLQTYLQYTGQVDAEGKKFSTNTDADGRFHSKWLNMMYPRLFLAKNLLHEQGLIFVTVDDTEVSTLRLIMNDIFGEEHFVASIAWEKRYTRSNNARLFYSLKDFVIVYRKSDALQVLREGRTAKSDAIYDNPDNDPRGPWTTSSYVNPATKEERPNLVYAIENPFTKAKVEHPTHAWKHSLAAHQRHVEDNRLWWGKAGEAKYPRLKVFLADAQSGLVPIDIWNHKETGTTDEGGMEIKELFGEAVFDNPKPTKLIRRMLKLATAPDEGAIVLDFFAGSGSTAAAVLSQNAEDDGNRRFILVQLPEPTSRQDFETISRITRERVKRTAQKLSRDGNTLLDTDRREPDSGFRALSLDASNLLYWDAHTAATSKDIEQQLSLHVHHLRPGRSDDDLLFEVLLREGFPPTIHSTTVEVGAHRAESLADGALIICLSRNPDFEAIRAIADRGPERVVCLDEGFAGNDQLKANASQLFKAKGIVFRTV